MIKRLLVDALNPHSEHDSAEGDIGNEIIPASIGYSHVHTFRFHNCENNDQPYWQDVGALDPVWLTKMDMVTVLRS